MKTKSPLQITEQNIETYPFTGDWQKLFGEPDIRFSTLIRGEAKSGKSTYCAKFAQYAAANFGRVLYVSAEERLNSQTLKSRLQYCGVTSERVRFIHTKDIGEIRAAIKTGGYRFVIIDSVQHVQMKYSDFETLRTEFKRRKLSWHLIMQMGENITKWRHEVDAVIDIKRGAAFVHGRYREAHAVRIINHQTNQPTLF